LYGREPEVMQLLNVQYTTANDLLSKSQSRRLLEVFTRIWATLDIGGFSISVGSDSFTLDFEKIKDQIDEWIAQLNTCKENTANNYYAKEEPSVNEQFKVLQIISDVDRIVPLYQRLKHEVDSLEHEFENAVQVYRSRIREALADLEILRHSVTYKAGGFSGFENVSVYVDKREADESFHLAVEAAHAGDVIVFVRGDGQKEFYTVRTEQGEKTVSEKMDIGQVQDTKPHHLKEGRLHMVYDEHRSENVVQALKEMGLVTGETKINMYGQVYGGRRSFQFAMDDPDHIRAVTSLRDPYGNDVSIDKAGGSLTEDIEQLKSGDSKLYRELIR
jgi:hypothetical protein